MLYSYFTREYFGTVNSYCLDILLVIAVLNNALTSLVYKKRLKTKIFKLNWYTFIILSRQRCTHVCIDVSIVFKILFIFAIVIFI